MRMQGPEPDRIGRQIALAAKAVGRRADDELAAHGSSLTDWIVLNAVCRCPGFIQHQLAAVMQIEGPTLTRHLDRMEAAGLIERSRDPSDRRILRVTATSKGAALREELLTTMDALDAHLVEGIPQRSLATFRNVVDRIAANAANTGDGVRHR